MNSTTHEGNSKMAKSTFEVWYAAVNAAVAAICGLSADDLADGPSRDSWEDGMSAKAYARMLLREEGF